ncbi:MAG: CSLREA domain-containing protein [Pirellulaceae bacterium]
MSKLNRLAAYLGWNDKRRRKHSDASRRRRARRLLVGERLDGRLLMAGDLAVPSLRELFADTFVEGDQPTSRTFIVTTNSDTVSPDGLLSLREAILAANANPGLDVIEFDQSLVGSTINLQDRALGALRITDDVRIQGWADNVDTLFDERVTIDGGGRDGYGTRIFDIDDGRLDNVINVELAGLVLTNGWTRAQDGAALRNMENTRVENVKFSHNRAHWQNTYARNESEEDWNSVGGAIANYHNLHLIDSEVVSNSAIQGKGGGGIYNAWNLLIEDSVVAENQTPNQGGGIYNDAQAKLELHDTLVVRNMAYGQGGGITNLGSLLVEGSELRENVTRGDVGGGALANGGVAIIHDSEFSYNKVMGVTANGVSLGGGAVFSTGSLTVEGSLFERNAVNVPTLTERNQAGGAIHVYGGSATIVDTTFRENKARDGGAIFLTIGELHVSQSIFDSNESIQLGTGNMVGRASITAVGPAFAKKYGTLTVDDTNAFNNNVLLTFGNSNIANSVYKHTQRSLEFDDAAESSELVVLTGKALSPIGARRR